MRGRPQGNWGALAPLCLLLFLFFLLTLGTSYKPVVVVHGLFDSPSEFSHLLLFINQVSPDAWTNPNSSSSSSIHGWVCVCVFSS
uniref:Palmitoyl-protein thioesterase 2 n=1 Tax=Gopherus agassizii TaxID=38772 RepID=A0A452HYS8_9SAUR